MTITRRLWGALLFLVFSAQVAGAQDVYNFYFQKKKPTESQDSFPQTTPSDGEYGTELVEIDDGDLPATSKKRSGEKYYKRVYVQKAEKTGEAKERVGKVRADLDNENDVDESERAWQVKLGIGSLIVDNHFNTPMSSFQLQQRTYGLGAAYHMSRYFEVNGELHLPNGEAEANGSTFIGNYNADPQLTIGLGATPIHLDVFGREFLAIGIDGGVAIGNESMGMGNSTRVYLGPRLSMNLSDDFSLIYAYRSNVSGDSEFSTNSFTLAYKW
jgi:hypothetical protein